MLIVAALLLALHGIAHLAGVRAAFWPSALERHKPSYLGRKLSGFVWLLLALGFVATAGLLVVRSELWAVVLIWASGGSLLMCLLAWPEAKIGLVINVVLLLMALLLTPSKRASSASIKVPSAQKNESSPSSQYTAPSTVPRSQRRAGYLANCTSSRLRWT